jgi:hypothetical protein
MVAQEETGSRRTFPTVVATASLTLALGVTLAALGGYLMPTRRIATAPPTAGVPTVMDTGTGAQAPSPAVVLVPVREASPSVCSSFPGAVPAAYRPHEDERDDDDEDDHPYRAARTHHGREREHDDDDD